MRDSRRALWISCIFCWVVKWGWVVGYVVLYVSMHMYCLTRNVFHNHQHHQSLVTRQEGWSPDTRRRHSLRLLASSSANTNLLYFPLSCKLWSTSLDLSFQSQRFYYPCSLHTTCLNNLNLFSSHLCSISTTPQPCHSYVSINALISATWIFFTWARLMP